METRFLRFFSRILKKFSNSFPQRVPIDSIPGKCQRGRREISKKPALLWHAHVWEFARFDKNKMISVEN